MLELLSLVDAPSVFPRLFVFTPPDFVDGTLQFVYTECLAKDPVLEPLIGRVNKSLFVAILYEFERLAAAYNAIAPDFIAAFNRSVASSQLSPDDMNVIKKLAESSHDNERRVAAVRGMMIVIVRTNFFADFLLLFWFVLVVSVSFLVFLPFLSAIFCLFVAFHRRGSLS